MAESDVRNGLGAERDAAAKSGAPVSAASSSAESVSGASSSPASASSSPLDMRRLVAEHHQDVYRYAYRLCGRQADAEDLTQQTFLQAQLAIAQLRDEAAARSWLLTILRRAWLRGMRQRIPASAAELDLEMNDVAETPDDPSPLDGEALQAALQQLPDDFRLVVLMYYFEDASYREIAAALDVPIGTVMSRLSRAKQYLRSLLKAESPNERGSSQGFVRPGAAR